MASASPYGRAPCTYGQSPSPFDPSRSANGGPGTKTGWNSFALSRLSTAPFWVLHSSTLTLFSNATWLRPMTTRHGNFDNQVTSLLWLHIDHLMHGEGCAAPYTYVKGWKPCQCHLNTVSLHYSRFFTKKIKTFKVSYHKEICTSDVGALPGT